MRLCFVGILISKGWNGVFEELGDGYFCWHKADSTADQIDD